MKVFWHLSRGFEIVYCAVRTRKNTNNSIDRLLDSIFET